MRAVNLCGGKGTRIRDISGEMPKPMMRIGRYPILKHIMDIYGRHGYYDFVLCLGYKGWDIKEYFLNYRVEIHDIQIDLASEEQVTYPRETSTPPWNIVLAETGLESQTGYRIKQIESYVAGETFMLTYGDGIGDVGVTAQRVGEYRIGAP